MNAASAPFNRDGFSPSRFGLLLAALVLAAFPQVIFGLETFVARDYGFFVYPLAHFQRECFWRGELPFWDPYNNCGAPFLAQWNTMPLYPPTLLYLALPFSWALGMFSLLHLWFAGLGMFFLARRWTGRGFPAAFAGTVFAFNGLTLNLLMWPSHIATFSWMPWVVLAAEGAWREGGKKIPLAACVGAMQFLAGGPETILLTWLVVSALWARQFFKAESPRLPLLWRLPTVVALAFALSAAQLLPFLDLVAHAQRGTGYTDLRWSMPGFGFANFLAPMAFGSTHTEGIFFQHGQAWTSSYYLGIGTLWLALAGALGGRDRPARLLAALSAIGLLCALGDHTPFYPLVRKLVPQLTFITYPVKFVMLAVFAAPLLAAFALESLAPGAAGPGGRTRPAAPHRRFFALGAVLFAALGAVVVWTQAAPMAGDDSAAALASGISRGAFLLLAAGALFVIARGAAAPLPRWMPLGLILIAWLDVYTQGPTQNPTVPPSVYELNLARTRLAMDPQPALGRSRAMLSPAAALGLTSFAVSNPRDNFLAKRIGLCANVNLLDAVPKVDGFFSLTPGPFDRLLTFRYDVTNGVWDGLDEFMGVSQYSSPTNFLAWLPRTNSLPVITAGQKPVFLSDDDALLAFGQNRFNPRQSVFLPPDDKALVPVCDGPPPGITNPEFANDWLDFEAEAAAPSLAVVAQTYYHDWRAEVDGHPAPLLRANVAFQAVPIPAGKHRVRLFYEDRAFEIGAAISVCMWINCLVAYAALRRRDLPASPGPANGDYF